MKYLRTIITSAIALIVGVITLHAADSVVWSVETAQNENGTQLIVSATPADGYHFYAFAPDGGYNSLELTAVASDGATIGEFKPSVDAEKHFDEATQTELASWFGPVKFTADYTLAEGVTGAEFTINVRYQACKDKLCERPVKLSLSTIVGDYTAKPEVVNDQAVEATSQPQKALSADGSINTDWWAPVEAEMPTTGHSGFMLLFLGFLGGLAALLTPCVWPIIPMTLSFFLKKTKKRGGRLNKDALTYGASIVVIYLILGLGITLIFGAGKLNELSTNAIFNIALFVILVVFAISFFGAFEIKLPSKWNNAIDNKAENSSGIISIFFMAVTLVLVSFSCTGPIIGTLLVEAASQGSVIGPLLGMGGFALGLAVPFTLFALFPGLLNRMPKSGGWLNSVKVVLGFVELILSLKFLSVADMAYGWRILDREVFISLWIVLFVLLGMYLLGKLRFSHDDKQEHVGVGRFFLAIFPFAFAVYLLPGLWGAPLKSCSAFIPPLQTQDFDLYTATYSTHADHFDDYDAAMKAATEQEKPLLVDFSGYGCVNCRALESNVLDSPEVRALLSEKFVVATLMVDDRKALATPFTVTVDGVTKTFTEVGEKWAFLEEYKFGASSQPYLIILDNNGNALSSPVFSDITAAEFITWLNEALSKYEQL